MTVAQMTLMTQEAPPVRGVPPIGGAPPPVPAEWKAPAVQGVPTVPEAPPPVPAERGSCAPDTRRDRLAAVLAGGTVRPGRQIGAGSGVLSDANLLPVLPALRGLLPHGALQRGSVVAAGGWSLLCLALAAGPVASGAWCAAAGIPGLGMVAAADAGLDPARLLLIPDPGPNWPQVVTSLLDGCDLVLLRPPERPPAQLRRKLEAVVRRHGAVLIVAGEWEGSQVRLRIAAQEWVGIGSGHGRLRGRRAKVVADGRGGWSRSLSHWLWLPGPDGAVAAVAGAAGVAGMADQADSAAAATERETGTG